MLAILLIHMSNIQSYTFSCVHPACRPSHLLRAISLTFQTDFLIAAVLTDTIDLYHYIPLSFALTLAGGHKVNGRQNLFSSPFGKRYELAQTLID